MEMGYTGCPKILVTNYRHTLHNILAERKPLGNFHIRRAFANILDITNHSVSIFFLNLTKINTNNKRLHRPRHTFHHRSIIRCGVTFSFRYLVPDDARIFLLT
jgi:hypothetical protein